MDIVRDLLAPDSLYRNPVWVSLLVGFGSPLVGVYLVLRRLIFLGVALPQISSTGIAFALSMHVWFGHSDETHGEQPQWLALAGSIGFTLVAILWLAILERRGRGSVESRLGTAYVVATAISILLLAKCPVAERGWLGLFKGEIIATSDRDLAITAFAIACVLLGLWLARREFLLVSFDRELAVTLGRWVTGWDTALFLLIGVTVAVSVLSVGPLIAFGFLLIPPLIARLFARNMRQLAIGASLVGGLSALAGFALAYRFDLPVGPTDVALLGALYAAAFATSRWWDTTRGEPARPSANP